MTYAMMKACFARFVLAITTLAFPLALPAQTDIEKNFFDGSTVDFSGTYPVTGTLVDSGTYSGTLTMEKWNDFKTPGKNRLQSFKMKYVFGENKLKGVAVWDGKRIWYCMGEGDGDNYYLLLLSKLEYSSGARRNLQEYWRKNEMAEKGVDYEWEGEEPWYAYLHPDAQAYGFFFWIDGMWGQYSTLRNGFPFTADTGYWKMLELKEDGSFGSKNAGGDPEGYEESGRFLVEQTGKNVRLEMTFVNDGVKSYWGTGFLTPHPKTGDNMLVAMLGGPENASVGWMQASGNTMTGVWAPVGYEGQATETWELPPEFMKKYPWLFK